MPRGGWQLCERANSENIARRTQYFLFICIDIKGAAYI
jgi:hypothetical protein